MGLSTYARNGIANGFVNGVPFVVPVQCFSLHDGNPGDEGTNAATTLIGTDEERAQATSSDATTGSTTSTGDPATWSITETATITYLGQHDAFSGGNWLGAIVVDQPVTVADGDIVTLSSFTATVV